MTVLTTRYLISSGFFCSILHLMDLKHFENKAHGEYEIILSGGVGFNFKGKEIAQEIRFLNEIGATKITQRINSGGGSVIDGYDIADANLNSNAIIETIITGLAASTAGWLAATGTPGHRYIVDYGKGMIHDPSLGSKNIDDLPEGAQKDRLLSIKDSIAVILSNRSNVKKEKINKMMTKETWLSAEQWVSLGFADQVQSTSNQPEINNVSNILEFVNICHEFNEGEHSAPKINKMKEVLNHLKLSEDAQESSALKAIQNLEQKAVDAENNLVEAIDKIEDLSNEVTELNNKAIESKEDIEGLQKVINGYKELELENAVSKAIESGKFGEDLKKELTNKAKEMGVDAFNSFVDMFNIPQANVLEIIDNGDKGEKKLSKEEKLAAEYQELSENNVAELKRIKNEEPSRFEEMFNAWNEA